jgi:hypothetical protein
MAQQGGARRDPNSLGAAIERLKLDLKQLERLAK